MNATKNLLVGSILIAFTALAGCNAITGADELTVEEGSASPPSGSGGATGGGRAAEPGTPSSSSATSGGAGASSGATTAASSSSSSGGATTGASSSSSSSSSGGDPLDQAAQLCVDTINQYRATLGLAPYARWTADETCGGQQAQKDSQTMTAHSAFGMCSEWAQNECPGWPGPPGGMIAGCLQMMWNEGPGDFNAGHGHYINMSSTQYTKVSCGFYTLADGSVWATQDFQ